MSKQPSVSVTELLHEIETGAWVELKPETRAKLIRMVNAMVEKVRERKATAPKKMRNTKAPALMSLPAWEKQQGAQLTIRNVQDWVTSRQLCPVMVMELIQEFRTEMVSKNKQYAMFDAAFKVYLTKGYLSKTIDQAKLAVSSHSQRVVRSIRGSSI